jgi:hypothetical protein
VRTRLLRSHFVRDAGHNLTGAVGGAGGGAVVVLLASWEVSRRCVRELARDPCGVRVGAQVQWAQ